MRRRLACLVAYERRVATIWLDQGAARVLGRRRPNMRGSRWWKGVAVVALINLNLVRVRHVLTRPSRTNSFYEWGREYNQPTSLLAQRLGRNSGVLVFIQPEPGSEHFLPCTRASHSSARTGQPSRWSFTQHRAERAFLKPSLPVTRSIQHHPMDASSPRKIYT